MMLSKAQIEALLSQQSIRKATEVERALLRCYVAEQPGEEFQQFAERFDILDVSVTAECGQSISFTWRNQSLHTLSDSYFITIPKKG